MARYFVNASLFKEMGSVINWTAEQVEKLHKRFPHSEMIKATDKYPAGTVVIADEARETKASTLLECAGIAVKSAAPASKPAEKAEPKAEEGITEDLC